MTKIRIYIEGYITGVSGEGRTYGSVIGIEPVLCEESRRGYCAGYYYTSLADSRIDRLRSEIQGIACKYIPQTGAGAGFHDLDLDLSEAAIEELELAKRISAFRAAEAAGKIRKEKQLAKEEAERSRKRREDFKKYLSLLPNFKAIHGSLDEDPVTLSAYSDGLGFTCYQFNPRNLLPKRACGGHRFLSLQEAMDFGFEPELVAK